MPKVSIILTTYNNPPFLKEALESVLNQTYTDWELILIVDPPFSGELERLIVEYVNDYPNKIKYIKNDKRVGFRNCLNQGLKIAEGEYIARIDDDDVWLPEKLAEQIEFLEKNKDYVLLGCGAIIIDENGKELYRFQPPTENEDIKKVILSRNPFVHSSVVFREETALSAGGYNAELKENEDLDLWLRLGIKGKMYNLNKCLVKYRNPFVKGAIEKIQRQRTKVFISIVKQYKDYYPGYCKAMRKNYLRLFYSYLPKPESLAKYLYTKKQEKGW